MPDTFGKLYKGLLHRCPDIPLTLAQDYIIQAYRKCLSESEWAGTRKRSEWYWPDAYTTGTISVTQGSTSVTGSSTVWAAASHDGFQLKIGDGPYYTVAINSSTTLTLDRPYGGTTASGQSYSLSKVYQTVPSDFAGPLISIIDPANRWKLHKSYTSEWLDARDPARSRTGSPLVVASASFSTGGLPRYELWPRPTTAGSVPFWYYKDVSDLSDDSDTLIYPIDGGTVMAYAIYLLARHPGVADRPNPYFNMQIASEAKGEYRDNLKADMLKDQSIYLTDFWRAMDEVPYAPLRDVDYLRDHDPFPILY